MPARLRRRVDALRAMTVPVEWGSSGAGPTVDPGVLTTVALACRDGEQLEFEYTAAGGPRTDRSVEPHRLVSLGRRWYLVGYDLTRHDWRSFRLDRLSDPESTGERFRPRALPAEDPAAFVRAGIVNLPTPYAVEAVVHAGADDVRPKIGQWATIEDLGDGRCTLRMTADSLDWPTLALGAIGAEFEVLSPPELAEHIREWGARFTRAVGT
jgi:predicted DNA-binding transcriptional regulator YafY